MIDNSYKVNVAVRIAIFPPWKISDVEGHAAINVGSLAVLALSYLILRQFTPAGGYGFEVSGVVTVFAFLFLTLCGIIISFVDPTSDAPKLSNRWSTFLIISFMYSTILLILVYLFPPLLTSGRTTIFDMLSGTFLGETGSLALVSVVTAALSVGALYWRARRWFRDALVMRPSFLGTSMTVCVMLNAALLYLLVFVI